jgi:hypothetical protein
MGQSCVLISFVTVPVWPQVYKDSPEKGNLLCKGILEIPPPGETLEAWHELMPPGGVGEKPRVRATISSALRPVEIRKEDETTTAVTAVGSNRRFISLISTSITSNNCHHAN